MATSSMAECVSDKPLTVNLVGPSMPKIDSVSGAVETPTTTTG